MLLVLPSRDLWNRPPLLPHLSAGDSRAVMQRSGEAVPVTQDHKPDREDEAVGLQRSSGVQSRKQEACHNP